MLVLEFSLVHEILLTSMFSTSIGCNFPTMVFIGMEIVLYSVLSIGMFSHFSTCDLSHDSVLGKKVWP